MLDGISSVDFTWPILSSGGSRGFTGHCPNLKAPGSLEESGPRSCSIARVIRRCPKDWGNFKRAVD